MKSPPPSPPRAATRFSPGGGCTFPSTVISNLPARDAHAGKPEPASGGKDLPCPVALYPSLLKVYLP